MNFETLFPIIVMGVCLGFGLAMDAFSVSLANGLNEPCMRKGKMTVVAGTFAVFQFLMPLVGWICVSTVARYFTFFQTAVPYIALVLLCYIGGKMLIESIKEGDKECCEMSPVKVGALLVQGIATSIDALSVGFTISDYNFIEALLACVIIGVLTFFICFAGLYIGKKAGTKLSGKAGILGGSILIFIGLEIFITSFF